jgi:hypothetical protein
MLGALSDPYPDWSWTTDIWIDVVPSASKDDAQTRASFVLTSAMGSQLMTRLPRIPGWSFRASASATDVRGARDNSGGFHRSVRAWSKTFPLVTEDCNVAPLGDVDLEVEVGPEAGRPSADGSLSRKSWGFEWERPGPARALNELALIDLAHGGLRWRIFTDAETVSLDHLEELGIPRPAPGEHMMDLTTKVNHSIDDLTNPRPERRHPERDRTRAGSAMSLRVPFRVTH